MAHKHAFRKVCVCVGYLCVHVICILSFNNSLGCSLLSYTYMFFFLSLILLWLLNFFLVIDPPLSRTRLLSSTSRILYVAAVPLLFSVNYQMQFHSSATSNGMVCGRLSAREKNSCALFCEWMSDHCHSCVLLRAIIIFIFISLFSSSSFSRAFALIYLMSTHAHN